MGVEVEIPLKQEITHANLQLLVESMGGRWYPSSDLHSNQDGCIEVGNSFLEVEYFPEDNLIIIEHNGEEEIEKTVENLEEKIRTLWG